MTNLPIAEQIAAAREPGWYWVEFCDEWCLARLDPAGDWHQEGWPPGHRAADCYWQQIGPRIPDPATLQQHERDRERYATGYAKEIIEAFEQPQEGHQLAHKLEQCWPIIKQALLDRERRKRAMKVVEAAQTYVSLNEPLEYAALREAIEAFDAAAPERNNK